MDVVAIFILADDCLQETTVVFNEYVPKCISKFRPSNCYCKFSYVPYKYKTTVGSLICSTADEGHSVPESSTFFFFFSFIIKCSNDAHLQSQ